MKGIFAEETMSVRRERLPFERVTVEMPWLLRRFRPALVSGQGVRRCQMRLRVWRVGSGKREPGRESPGESSGEGSRRLWVVSRRMRASRWCSSTVFQARDGLVARVRVKVR